MEYGFTVGYRVVVFCCGFWIDAHVWCVISGWSSPQRKASLPSWSEAVRTQCSSSQRTTTWTAKRSGELHFRAVYDQSSSDFHSIIIVNCCFPFSPTGCTSWKCKAPSLARTTPNCPSIYSSLQIISLYTQSQRRTGSSKTLTHIQDVGVEMKMEPVLPTASPLQPQV